MGFEREALPWQVQEGDATQLAGILLSRFIEDGQAGCDPPPRAIATIPLIA